MEAEQVPENAEQIAKFLDEWAGKHDIAITLYPNSAREYSSDLITFPAASGSISMGAYERAELLQRVEEAWNYKEPAPSRQVMLLPASPKRTSVTKPLRQRSVKRKKNHAIQ